MRRGKVEEPTRDLLEHAIRGELDELAELMAELGPERMLAQRAAAVDLDFNLEESGAYAFLARVAIGFEPLFDVFPDKEGRAVMVPILATATLLASYRGSPRHWWEYLDATREREQTATILQP